MLATSLPDCEAVLVDVGGTLLHGDQAIPGASDFLFALKKKRKPFFIVANNVTESTQEVLQKLKHIGAAVSIENMITASQSAIAYAQQHNIQSVHIIGSETQRQEWADAGFHTHADRPDAIIAGIDVHMTYDTLTQLMRMMHEGARLIALSQSMFHVTPVGATPGVGPLLQYLHAVTGKRPEIIAGKPSLTFFQYCISRVGVPAAHTAIVGDQMGADMTFAEEYGMVSALVLSGQTTREDLREHAYQPDYVVESVDSLTPLFR